MQIIDLQVTLTGTPIVINVTNFATLATVASPSGALRCTRIDIFPLSTNTHSATVLGPAGNQLKWLNAPQANTPLDSYSVDVKEGRNLLNPSQLSVNGTASEKLFISVYVG